jgi:outer membrane immunogenic protein
MKKLATAIAAIALIGTPAFAATPKKKPPPPPPPPAPIYNWTGWYVGGNVGASFGNVKTDVNGAPVEIAVTIPVTPGFANRDDEVYPSGFVGGGQIGYNWQFSPIWVAGLEADFQGALERASANLSNPFSNFSVPLTQGTSGTAVTGYTTKIDWFGTVRGRIGYVWGNGNVMSYLTGGFAYGKVDIEGTSTVTGSGLTGLVTTVPFAFSVTQAIAHNAVNTGWVVGTGTEGELLIPGWTYKIEWLYMDLGTLDATGVTSGATCINLCVGPVPVTGGQVATHSHFTDTILRAGLNYQFH